MSTSKFICNLHWSHRNGVANNTQATNKKSESPVTFVPSKPLTGEFRRAIIFFLRKFIKLIEDVTLI